MDELNQNSIKEVCGGSFVIHELHVLENNGFWEEGKTYNNIHGV